MNTFQILHAKVWLIFRLNEMGLHYPITGWYLNEKHTPVKPCSGGRFCLPHETRLSGTEGGGEGGDGWTHE